MINQTEIDARFPRSSQYSLEWVREGAMGSNVLWLTEWLCKQLELRPGMRVLDLGCGRAKSSIFLAREFGVQVWATDLWIAASENWQRICEVGLQEQVFPLHADARAMPFAGEFFDIIVALDCFPYFGTDDLYLNYLVHFVKPGGQIAIAGAGLVKEMPSLVPDHLREFWSPAAWALHTVEWWRRHWERTGFVEIQQADRMNDGWKLWSQWQQFAWPHNETEIKALEQDAGRMLTYVRLIARRREGIMPEEYAWPDNLRSIPQQYEPKPMLLPN